MACLSPAKAPPPAAFMTASLWFLYPSCPASVLSQSSQSACVPSAQNALDPEVLPEPARSTWPSPSRLLMSFTVPSQCSSHRVLAAAVWSGLLPDDSFSSSPLPRIQRPSLVLCQVVFLVFVTLCPQFFSDTSFINLSFSFFLNRAVIPMRTVASLIPDAESPAGTAISNL